MASSQADLQFFYLQASTLGYYHYSVFVLILSNCDYFNINQEVNHFPSLQCACVSKLLLKLQNSVRPRGSLKSSSTEMFLSHCTMHQNHRHRSRPHQTHAGCAQDDGSSNFCFDCNCLQTDYWFLQLKNWGRQKQQISSLAAPSLEPPLQGGLADEESGLQMTGFLLPASFAVGTEWPQLLIGVLDCNSFLRQHSWHKIAEIGQHRRTDHPHQYIADFLLWYKILFLPIRAHLAP